jgi:hypothetical protein
MKDRVQEAKRRQFNTDSDYAKGGKIAYLVSFLSLQSQKYTVTQDEDDKHSVTVKMNGALIGRVKFPAAINNLHVNTSADDMDSDSDTEQSDSEKTSQQLSAIKKETVQILDGTGTDFIDLFSNSVVESLFLDKTQPQITRNDIEFARKEEALKAQIRQMMLNKNLSSDERTRISIAESHLKICQILRKDPQLQESFIEKLATSLNQLTEMLKQPTRADLAEPFLQNIEAICKGVEQYGKEDRYMGYALMLFGFALMFTSFAGIEYLKYALDVVNLDVFDKLFTPIWAILFNSFAVGGIMQIIGLCCRSEPPVAATELKNPQVTYASFFPEVKNDDAAKTNVADQEPRDLYIFGS